MNSNLFRKNFLLIVILLISDQFGKIDSKVRIDPRKNDVETSEIPPDEVDEEVLSRMSESLPQESYVNPKTPHFTNDSPRTILAGVGSPAHIPCNVRNLGSKSVSWIRHRDLHVLTVGSFTFTNDDRFSAHRDPTSGDWVLVLRHPQPSDSGKYECSISTKPVTGHTIQLNIVVPSAELLGKNKNAYLDQGSTLNLTCVVHFSPTPPEFILWYHREKLVDYRKKGRDIVVTTVHEGDTTRSSLLVQNATLRDSGKYSCKPSNANLASVVVHVLKSETPAAMQTTTTNSQPINYLNPIIYFISLNLANILFLLDLTPMSLTVDKNSFNLLHSKR